MRYLVGLCLLLCFVKPSFGQEQLLAQGDGWYLPTADKVCRLYVFEVGTGTPVVVVHGGFGAEHSYLLDAVRGLTNKYHFIFYDQRGSLRSPCKLESISFETHVADLELIRTTLGLTKVNILAHSMGTMLTAEYMKEHPDSVGKVVLIGALPMKSGKFLGPEFPALVGMDAAAKLMGDRAEVKSELARILKEERAGPKRETHGWHVNFAAVNVYHIDRWPLVQGGQVYYAPHAGNQASNDMEKVLTNDFDFSVDFTGHPRMITVVNGDHDYADWGNAFYTKFQKEVPMHLVILKDAGHSGWIDDPIEFRNALVRGFGR